MPLEYFGVYYNSNMYYLSTSSNTDVLKQFLEEEIKIRVIENSKIPNNHLQISGSKTRHLQGQVRQAKDIKFNLVSSS